ncbi:hypothetical protein MMU07_21365, partial [Aquiflexum sp. LQ15W]|uniref:hypothetical protein n=1 Tax=Cognataquiflexum nitidum TaxID=2922272 RepID=UPI001F131566
ILVKSCLNGWLLQLFILTCSEADTHKKKSPQFAKTQRKNKNISNIGFSKIAKEILKQILEKVHRQKGN